MTINKVIIIGAGPAGISAAIQLKRSGIEPILLEKGRVGGLLQNANNVENYPGFVNGISGPQLVGLLKEHLENTGVKIIYEEVMSLEHNDGVFEIQTNLRTLLSRIVVISSGTKPLKPTDLKISAGIDNRIHYEVHPISGIKNEKIAIYGAGDAAFDYALNLADKNQVVVLNRGADVRCLPLLFRRSARQQHISYIDNIRLTAIERSENDLKLICKDEKGNREIIVAYLLIAIGRVSCLDFLDADLKENIEHLQESRDLYLVGDVKNGIYRQTAIAVGDGIKAAMEISRKMGESG